MNDTKIPEKTAMHTPGPWGNGAKNNGDPCIVAGASVVCYITKRWHTKSPEEWKANARLIASAPDLLDALYGLIELGRKDTSNEKYDGYFDAAKAAIAKAEGR